MVRRKLADCLQQAAIEAQQEGNIIAAAPPEAAIEHPQDPEHGDFASGLPLKLARTMKMSPLAIAEKIVEHLSPPPEIGRVVIAPPGFINFPLRDDWLTEQVKVILSAGESYGNLIPDRSRHIQIEFVSVNPTGPLHVGHGRGAIMGSTLANILTAAGHSVEKEYYLNDAGTQIDTFARSLYARYQQQMGKEVEMPPGSYMGNYMIDLAKEIASAEGDSLMALPADEASSKLGKIGLSKMVEDIKQDLRLVNVEFDNWFNETKLYQDKQYDRAMALLKEKGYVSERDNAIWFESSTLGEDKDNVLVRSDGSPTYFAADVAYHYNKFWERGFDTVIDIWGADHQGHVPRMKAAIRAMGKNPEHLKLLICQLVTLRRGKEVIRISKRSGDIITLREVVDEVGTDACRFIFLSRSADSQMDFDIELAKKQSADNPVYYVQYAHARIASILRLASQQNIDCSQGDVSLLSTEPELTLIRRLILLPEIVEEVTNTLEPHHLPYYAQNLATAFHSFYKQCRVVSQDSALTMARLKLVMATRIVLSRTLHLMGMTAPERM